MPGMDGLRADVIGGQLLGKDGDRAGRTWALDQMRRTSLLTALSAVSAVCAFDSHDWIGGVDVPTAVIITRHDQAGVSGPATEASRCGARGAGLRHPRRSRCLPHRSGPLHRHAARCLPGDLFVDSDITGPTDPAAGLTAS